MAVGGDKGPPGTGDLLVVGGVWYVLLNMGGEVMVPVELAEDNARPLLPPVALAPLPSCSLQSS